MKNLRERIHADKLIAFKAGDKKTVTILSVLLSELEQKGKTSTDDEVIREMKKMVENARLCGTTEEAEVLEKYLPKMMTEDHIEHVLDAFLKMENITERKDMGKVMAHCKQQFGSTMNMGYANKFLATRLK